MLFLRKNKKGFTLIELLVVVGIIGVLASIIVASLNSARAKANRAAGLRFSASTYNIMGDQAVGVWDFDECSGATVSDKSGTGNTGSLLMGATWSTNTPTGIGCSLSLDGIDDYVLVSTDEISDAEGSVFAWAYPIATAGNAYVFQGNSDGGGNRLYLQWSNGNFNATRSNPGVMITIKAGAPFNVWQHIGLSWKNGMMTAYYNGAQVGVASSFTQTGFGWTTSFIGQQGGGAKNFPGLIDDVRAYSRSLNASDIKKLYAEGLKQHKLAVK